MLAAFSGAFNALPLTNEVATIQLVATSAAGQEKEPCASYDALLDDKSYIGMKGVEWCEKNCAVGFCPEDRCLCLTAADIASRNNPAY